MKMLLVAINAKYIHSNLAVHSLAEYARLTLKCDNNIEIKEFTINQLSEEILKGIYQEHPDVVAISVYIWNRSIVASLLPELQKVLPSTEFWLGGPEVSFDLESQMSKFPMIRGIMYGEGEATFAELVETYLQQEKTGEPVQLESIRGIIYRKENILCNPPRETMPMDDIPFPYSKLEEYANRIIYYETSRGCPFCCAYCLSSVEKTMRFRSFSLVSKELQFFLDHHVPQVKFVDRTFNCNHEHAIQILKYIKENDNGVTNFHFEIAGDILTEEEINLITSLRPGLVQLEIGVQSTNARTLETINRRTNLEILKTNVARLLAPRNAHLHLDLIAGLPYEDIQSFANSFNEVFAMGSDELQLGFLKMLYGAPLQEHAMEHGVVSRDEPPYEVLMTKYLSYEDVLHLKEVEEMLEIYHNSGQFINTLKWLLREEMSPYSFFENVAEFYKAKEYPVITVSRVRRYEILLEYIEAKNAEDICMRYGLWDNANDRLDTYKELLTLDYYLRENAKKRPAFAPAVMPHDSTMVAFYQREALMHQFLHGYDGFDAKQLQKMTHTETFCHIMSSDGANPSCRFIFDYKRMHPVTKAATILQVLGEEMAKEGVEA